LSGIRRTEEGEKDENKYKYEYLLPKKSENKDVFHFAIN